MSRKMVEGDIMLLTELDKLIDFMGAITVRSMHCGPKVSTLRGTAGG